MKKLAIIGVLILGALYGGVDIFAFLGFGKGVWGISDKDPLGKPEKIHQQLIANGFEGTLGEVGKSRKLVYSSGKDKEKYPDWTAGVVVVVGEEEYVQEISGIFVGTQHGYSPQRPGAAEIVMSDLWKFTGGPSKPTYNTVTDGTFKFPYKNQFGKPITRPINHKEAKFETKDVVGVRAYGEGSPMESVELKLR